MDHRVAKFLAKYDGKTVRELHIPDTHTPHCDHWKWVCDVAADYKPHIVRHLGDWREHSAISQYPSDDVHPQADENELVAQQARELREAVGSRTLLQHHEGNHGLRWEKLDPRIRQLYDWRRDKLLAAEWDRWVHTPYEYSRRGCFLIGQVLTAHGFESNEDLQALYLWNLVGWPGGELLASTAHTHKQQEPVRVMRTKTCGLPVWRANAGTLGPLKPSFVKNRRTNNWAPGLLLVEQNLTASTGKNWEATLVTP